MKFFEYKSAYDYGKNFEGEKLNHQEFYDLFIHRVKTSDMIRMDKAVSHNQLISEAEWYKFGRPYYNVYPSITKFLSKIKEENILADSIRMPHRALLFRFAECESNFNFQFKKTKYYLKSVLAFLTDETTKNGTKHQIWFLWMDLGEVDQNGMPILVYRKFVFKKGYTLDQAIKELEIDQFSLSYGVQVPTEIIDKAARCIIGCCLLSKDFDDDLIQPDILNADKEKWLQTRSEKYILRAHKRGKVGWNVGANLEISPHYRSGSPLALYWTGQGRRIPLYRAREGCWIKKNIIKQIPTGKLD